MATSQGLSLKVISLGMTDGLFSRIIFESHFLGDDGWPRLKDYL